MLEADVSLTPHDLHTLRTQYEAELPHPSPSTKFNYAWGLVRSKRSEDTEAGVRLLYQLYRDEPELTRECLYYLSMGEIKLGNYTEARKYARELLKMEPTNSQASALLTEIEERVTREGLIGLGIAGGAVAVAGLVVAGLVKIARG